MLSYQQQIAKIIDNALEEEDYQNDYTLDLLFDNKKIQSGAFITHTSGVSSGIEIVCLVYQKINPKIKINILKESGHFISRGDAIASIEGPIKDILRGQKIAVNILKRMSGIATLTNRYLQEIKSTNCNLIDFQDNTPNFQILEKRAFIDGGGYNYAFHPNEQIFLSVNHFATMGALDAVIEKIKANHLTKNLPINVEVENMQEFLEAVNSKCDTIFVSKMDNDLSDLVEINNHDKLIIAKGSYSLGKVHSIAISGVDYLCVDNLVSTYKALDIELRFYKGL